MKTIIIGKADVKIPLDFGNHICLVVENKMLFYNIGLFLFNDFQGEDELIQLYDGVTEIHLDEIAIFVPALFDLSINSKKNLNALYKILKSLYNDDIKNGIKSIHESLMLMLGKIRVDYDLDLAINESLSENDLFKIADIKIAESESVSLLDQLLKYINVHCELRKTKIIFILEMNSYLNQDQKHNLYEALKYKEVSIVSVDNHCPTCVDNMEKMFVVDDDLCFIK